VHKEAKDKVNNLAADPETNIDYLCDTTEKFCQEKAIHNGIRESIEILDGRGGKDRGAIPKILQDALAVGFDTSIGHDYLEDWVARFESYSRTEERIATDLELLNRVLGGGVPRKTLNMIMAPTGVGKTLMMCHLAASNLAAGRNVLYITLEMAETGHPSISQRIDANLLDISLAEMPTIPMEIFKNKITRLREKTLGKLIVKEFPTGAASTAHFRHVLNELRTEEKLRSRCRLH
jgi:hypothetical protein